MSHKTGNITLNIDKGTVYIKNGSITLEDINNEYVMKNLSFKKTAGLIMNDTHDDYKEINVYFDDLNQRPNYHYDLSDEEKRDKRPKQEISVEPNEVIVNSSNKVEKSDDPCSNVCADLAKDDVEPVCMMYSRYKRGFHLFMNHCHARRSICLDNLDLHYVHPSRCTKSLQFFMPII